MSIINLPSNLLGGLICPKQIYVDTEWFSISSQPDDYDDLLDNV